MFVDAEVTYTHFPKEKEVYTDARILGIIFFTFYFGICALGTLVQFTSLFDKEVIDADEDIIKNKSPTGVALLWFSPVLNLKRIFLSSYEEDHYLNCWYGVRTITIALIIPGQTYLYSSYSPISNVEDMESKIIPSFRSGIYEVWPDYTVDIFLCSNAFLATYLLLKTFKTEHKINYLKVYVNKIKNILVPSIIMMIFVMTFFEIISTGPIYSASADVLLYGE